MFGFTVILKSELQSMKLSEKALLAQSEQLLRERNEAQLKMELIQMELVRYKPIKDEKGKFVKRTQ